MTRYRALAVYTAMIALVGAFALARSLDGVATFPPPWVCIVAVAVCLLVWQFGVPAPRVGLTSMERVPQVALLLILGPPVAAALAAAASLLWPFLNRTYRQGSKRMAVLRGVHNAAMSALMLLLAGEAYLALGGRLPLTSLSMDDVVPLTGLALIAQVVNVALLALFFRYDGRDVRSLIKPIYSAIDLAFVPAGVLAALLHASATKGAFALFCAVMFIFLVSFGTVGRALGTAESTAAPIERAWRAGRSLHGIRRVDALGERVLGEAHALFQFDEFVLALLDRELGRLEVRIHAGDAAVASHLTPDSALLAHVMTRTTPLLIEDWHQADASLRALAASPEDATGCVLATPLRRSGEAIGLLLVRHPAPNRFTDTDVHLIERLAEQVAGAISDARAFEDLERYRQRLEDRVATRTRELEAANEAKERLIAALGERSRTLERESQEDPLTGLANRRRFTERLAAEIEVARAVGRSLALAVADVDRFKAINDDLGHAVGDAVLQLAAEVLQRGCRETDLAARLGGDEFAVILPGCDRDAALARCEELRASLQGEEWNAVHPDLAVTASVGVAAWSEPLDGAALLREADARLYRAKHAGRNRVA